MKFAVLRFYDGGNVFVSKWHRTRDAALKTEGVLAGHDGMDYRAAKLDDNGVHVAYDRVAGEFFNFTLDVFGDAL